MAKLYRNNLTIMSLSYVKNIKEYAIVSISISFSILIFAFLFKKFSLNVIDITEQHKCPACFGLSMCQEIVENKVNFAYTNFPSVFNNIFGVKNIYYGKYKGEPVIMKKLAHTSELETFDQLICNDFEVLELCFKEFHSKRKKGNFYHLIRSELNNSNMSDPNNKIRVCPSIEHIDELLSYIRVKSSQNDENLYKIIWTSIKINPEPVILQLLSAADGWPTPKYFGACGRLIIEEYSGQPLSAFINEPWIKRVKIASSLLEAAFKFTYKNSKFAFYLTDISMDNIVINDENEAIFIDLENIIIVDKFPPLEVIQNITEWNEIYSNDLDVECENCFVFSPSDICNHKISDHNYYAVCQHIIVQSEYTNTYSTGFLHNLPQKILSQYPMLTTLLKQCSKPNMYHSRIVSGIQLKKLLDTIVNNYEKSSSI